MVGTMALRIRASFIDSWPTIAVNGIGMAVERDAH